MARTYGHGTGGSTATYRAFRKLSLGLCGIELLTPNERSNILRVTRRHRMYNWVPQSLDKVEMREQAYVTDVRRGEL